MMARLMVLREEAGSGGREDGEVRDGDGEW
jgi:hypothetical protein